MTRDEHCTRHFLLHQSLDELIADYLVQHWGSRPSTVTVMELLEWSRAQCLEPTFTCSRCGKASYNPNDAEHRYCGACHAFVDDGGDPR
jgi:hypothetical protein